MSKKNGNDAASVATIVESMTPEQREAAAAVIDAVNLDEVTTETLLVKVRSYKLVDVMDDEGNALLDDDGKALQYRAVTTRTARIQNFVPVPLFHQAISIQKKLTGGDLAEQLDVMTSFVLKVWQVSEPWMTLEKLQDGLDVEVISKLFKVFFGLRTLQFVNRA